MQKINIQCDMVNRQGKFKKKLGYKYIVNTILIKLLCACWLLIYNVLDI